MSCREDRGRTEGETGIEREKIYQKKHEGIKRPTRQRRVRKGELKEPGKKDKGQLLRTSFFALEESRKGKTRVFGQSLSGGKNLVGGIETSAPKSSKNVGKQKDIQFRKFIPTPANQARSIGTKKTADYIGKTWASRTAVSTLGRNQSYSVVNSRKAQDGANTNPNPDFQNFGKVLVEEKKRDLTFQNPKSGLPTSSRLIGEKKAKERARDHPKDDPRARTMLLREAGRQVS